MHTSDEPKGQQRDVDLARSTPTTAHAPISTQARTGADAAAGAEREALRAADQRWQLLFQQSPLSIQTFAPDGSMRNANGAWERLFGVRREQLSGFNLLHDPQLIDRGVMPYVLRAFAGETTVVPPIRYDLGGLPGGQASESRWIGAVMFPLLDAEGRVMEVVCMHEDVTERKRAEDEVRRLNASLERRVQERTAELAASEATLRTLVEHAPEAIVVFDGDTGRFVTVNENAVKLYGLSREQLVSLTPAEVSPPAQPDGRGSGQAARERIDEALNQGSAVFEWMHRHSSGRQVPCEVRLVSLPSPGKRLVRASILDYSERYRQERARQVTYQIAEAVLAVEDLPSLYARIHAIVRQSMPAENFYLAILDPASERFSFPYFVDERDVPPPPMQLGSGLTSYVFRTGKALLVNRDTQIERSEAGVAVLVTPEDRAAYAERGSPAKVWLGVPLTLGGRTLGVMALQDYHDDHAYGENEKQLLNFVASQIALAIDRKRAEASLRESQARRRESEERFSTVFHVSPILISLARSDTRKFVEVNEAFLNWSGYTREEVIGRDSAELSLWLRPSDRDDFWQELQERRQIRHKEFVFRNRQGSTYTVLLSADLLHVNDKPHVLVVGVDFTGRKQAEAELLRALSREKELGQLKSSFVSMVSHEFRTPLGVISSSAEILRDYFDRLDRAERHEHLESIHQNTRRMAQLMEEVLLLSRFEAGKADFQPATVDLRRFCERVVERMQQATHYRCPIELRFEEAPAEVVVDERLLEHVFGNLLNNAVKYSAPGDPIEFVARGQANEVAFAVRDRGIGIPESDRPWLFTAFHRGRNVGERNGTGLGLVIVKRCVEMHRGHLQVESQVGQGTCITVVLPAAPAQSATPAIVPATF